MKFSEQLLVKPGHKVRLEDFDSEGSAHVRDKDHAAEIMKKRTGRLEHLQQVLYAENKHALLIILQGMDAAGKDGTIRHVMSGVNPQGCDVTSFKVPTPIEASHDFLWRIHNAVPPRGMIGIFNRSQYEDVLVVRVHNLVPKKIWEKRYDQINEFEELLTENSVTILKFFLHISKDEQQKRFTERHEDPRKYWKVSASDASERKYWDDYQRAYEVLLSKCSKKHAPWFVIPANKKWFRDLAVAGIIIEALENLKMKFPAHVADGAEVGKS